MSYDVMISFWNLYVKICQDMSRYVKSFFSSDFSLLVDMILACKISTSYVSFLATKWSTKISSTQEKDKCFS